MSALLELIRRTDDDYLAGLTNKGTVKRAYKDLEQASPAVSFEGEDARVTLSDAVCLIKAPLGESTCSCPSRSICRHIVTAILWLKKQDMQEEGEAAQNPGPVQGGTEASDPERIQKDAGLVIVQMLRRVIQDIPVLIRYRIHPVLYIVKISVFFAQKPGFIYP